MNRLSLTLLVMVMMALEEKIWHRCILLACIAHGTLEALNRWCVAGTEKFTDRYYTVENTGQVQLCSTRVTRFNRRVGRSYHLSLRFNDQITTTKFLNTKAI